MATQSDVEQVRRNTNVDQDDPVHTFAVIEGYVDVLGITGASAKIWLEKSAAYADLVDISEAGASERLGQLKDQALDMAKYWAGLAGEESGTTTNNNRVKLHSLTRGRA